MVGKDREVIGRKDDSVGKAVRKGWEGGGAAETPWQTGGHTRQEGLKRGTRCKLNPADESVNKGTQQGSKWHRVMRELGEVWGRRNLRHTPGEDQ